DGDLDVVVNNVNQKALIYENQTSKKTKNNYLQVNLRGTGKNKFAIGSRVKLYYQKQIFDQECMPVRGFQSSVDYKLTFGLGKISTLDSLEIIWPNKKVEKVKNVKTNQKLTFFKKNASGIYVPSKKTIDKPYFTKEKNQPFLTHKEDRYNDFEFEGLVPEMLSKQGPAIAIADIDHNGLDDIFIGGAYNEPSRIYLQKKLGVFTQTNFSNETFFEDTAAVFADIDNDNDLDLIVGSGGNFKNARTGVRVYLNKGNGSFTDYKILAKIHANIATIKPYDYDNDGDIDLFVGSLSVPQVYGMNPKSLLLENNGKGNFKDVTFSKAKKLKNLGMITDAKWQDMDNDGIKDLIVIGKWMSPYIFKNNGNSLTEMKSNLSKISGDFTALNVADIDNDGDFDIILGNRGNNSFYKADSTHVAKMFVYDFDNNGSIEQIFTRTINQKDVPVHLLKELRAQLLSIKNKHYTFKSYATKSIDEIFSKETLNRALVKQINTFQSVVLINNNLNFTIKKLPIRAQMSTINSILVKDINNDGNLDLITAGNNYNYKTQYTRQDASYGDIYFGDGKGNFTWQPFEKTGFFIKGQINNMRFLNQNKPIKYLIVGPNNKKPQLFKINE
ncbi:MAG: FG-GAP-like repeat-containing protein, partial [Lutibacter sp.]